MRIDIVTELVKHMTKHRNQVLGVRVLGLTFKENCPDLPKTKLVDIVRELADYEIAAEAYNPWVSTSDA